MKPSHAIAVGSVYFEFDSSSRSEGRRSSVRHRRYRWLREVQAGRDEPVVQDAVEVGVLALERGEQKRLLLREMLARQALEALAVDVRARRVRRGAPAGGEAAREHVVVRDERAH